MNSQRKDPLAELLFSLVAFALLCLSFVMILGGVPIGGMLGGWCGTIADQMLLSRSIDPTKDLGPLTMLGLLIGMSVVTGCGFLLLAALIEEECAPHRYGYQFFDAATDLVSAVIRGIGSVLVSAGQGVVMGGLVILLLFLVKLYCDRVGIPLPTLADGWRATLLGLFAFIGVLYQLHGEECPVAV